MLWSVLRLIFKTSSVTPDFFYVFNLILSFSTGSQSFKKNLCVGSFWARTSLSGGVGVENSCKLCKPRNAHERDLIYWDNVDLCFR